MDGETKYVYLNAQHSYDMLPSTEHLSVGKLTLCNNGTQTLLGRGGNHIGDYFLYEIDLTGSLLEPEVKTYEDLRIVDLLPDGIRYDLNNNGETNDKIAYAFSDATIIAAQSMYAEKFIAPAGSDSWSKQGLLVKAGSDFDYLLEIVNETAAVHTGMTVYDALPRIGDPNLFGASGPRLGIPGPPAQRHHAAGGLYGLLHHERRCLHPFHGGDGERRYLGSHSLRLRVRHRLQARRRRRDRAGRELKIPGPDPGMRAEDL